MRSTRSSMAEACRLSQLLNPASSWMAFLLSCSLNSLSKRGQIVGRDAFPERQEVAAGINIGVHVRAELGPPTQHRRLMCWPRFRP